MLKEHKMSQAVLNLHDFKVTGFTLAEKSDEKGKRTLYNQIDFNQMTEFTDQILQIYIPGMRLITSSPGTIKVFMGVV